MVWISKTSRTRRGRMTTRRNPISSTTNRVSIPATTQSRVSMAKPVVSAVASIAKKAVRKSTETKLCSESYDTTHNSTIGTADPFPLCPQVAQGSDDFQRQGDRIFGKYLYIKGKVQYDKAYFLSNNTTFVPPSTVRVMILSQRNINSSNLIPGQVQVAYLLKDNVGTGSGRQYLGGPWDNLAPINRELFTVHMDKKIRLNWLKPFDSSTGSDAAASGTQLTRYFYCKIKINKQLRFDDSLSNSPTNFAPFFLLGGVNDDGEAAYTTGTPYHVSMLSSLYYTDA